MPYTISTIDGSVVLNIPDSQFNTTSSLTLPGPNTPGWGGHNNQNLLNLLTNFASSSSQKPAGQSLQGQLWYDETHQNLNVYNPVTGYVPVSGILVDPTQPTSSAGGVSVGTIWFNSTTNQMSMCTSIGSSPTYTPAFTLIGPLFTSQQGPSGAIPVIVNDAVANGVTHNIVKLQFGSIVVAIISSDPTFAPSPAIPGFTLVHPGLSVSTLYYDNQAQNYTNANVAAYLPLDPTIIGINSSIAGTVTSIETLANTIIGNTSVTLTNAIVTANTAVVSYVNNRLSTVNGAISAINANVTSANATISAASATINSAVTAIVTANTAVVSYVNNRLSTVGIEISAINANVTSANATISAYQISTNNTFANVTAFESYANATFITSTYTNANVSAYLPTYTGNISAQNLSVTGKLNGASHTVMTTVISIYTPTIIFNSPTYCSFCTVTGDDGAGNRFSDVVLMSVGTVVVNVISSLSASGTPAARTYFSNAGTLKLQISGTYTVKTIAISI